MAFTYDPPAGIDDFSKSKTKAQSLRDNWNGFIGGSIAGRDEHLFFDAANDPDATVKADRVPIPWNAFPRAIFEWFNADSDATGLKKALAVAEILRPITAIVVPTSSGDAVRWISLTEKLPPLRKIENGKLGDPISPVHRQQDEYCEWHVDRNASGGMTRITYTCEGPEYWSEMARIDLDLVVELYQAFVDASVKRDDLVWPFDVAAFNSKTRRYQRIARVGDYNPYNRWNTVDGAMHLTHPANTLGAEINLAADATVVRSLVDTSGNPDEVAQRLICCAQYGDVNRSSDPLIGAGVNGAARKGLAVTLANPVGLYMNEIKVGGLRDDKGKPVGAQTLSTPRASSDGSMILRAEIKPPVGAAFTLDRCTIDGDDITGGGEIARKITMSLFGSVKRAPIPSRTPTSKTTCGKCCSKDTKIAKKVTVDAPNFLLGLKANDDCTMLEEADFADSGPFIGSQAPVVPEVALVAEVAAFRVVAEPELELTAAIPKILTLRKTN